VADPRVAADPLRPAGMAGRQDRDRGAGRADRAARAPGDPAVPALGAGEATTWLIRSGSYDLAPSDRRAKR